MINDLLIIKFVQLCLAHKSYSWKENPCQLQVFPNRKLRIQLVNLFPSEFDVTASTDCSSDYVTITTGDPAQVKENTSTVEKSEEKNREALPPGTAASRLPPTSSPWASCWRSSFTPTRSSSDFPFLSKDFAFFRRISNLKCHLPQL